MKKREYALQLPNNYVEIDREEMEYVEGGLAIGRDFAASAFNVLIGIAIGGGVGAIQSWIISQGKREAKRIFTRTITSKLIAWGADYLAWIVGTAVTFALDYCNIGSAIASFIDAHDTYYNNTWLGERVMKKILKSIIAIVYAFLVLYLSNKFIEIRHLSKNIYYFIIVFPILFIGVFGILTLFRDKNNNGTI